MRRFLALLALLLLALLGVAGRAAGATVRIGGSVAPPLPQSFAGLSVETTLIPKWFPMDGCHSPARGALALLGRPQVRVGGESQDRLWPTQPLPPGEHQVASLDYFHALHCVSATGSPLIVGLNLLGRDAKATGDLLATAEKLVTPERTAISIGNEPNLYGSALPSPGDYAGYLQLYGQTLDSLRGRFGGLLPPVAGPDPATWRWTEQTARFIADEHPAVVDEHLYGLNSCHADPGDPDYPTIDQLLRPFASTDLIAALSPVVHAARRAHIPAEITEANSVACRGTHGVSDAPASALWALNLLGSAATEGFSRVDFHSSEGYYDPFVVSGDKVTFRPLFTALALADRLWPAGSVPVHVVGHLPSGLSVWAARRPGGAVALLAVDTDATHARRVAISAPSHGARAGRLLRDGGAVSLNGQRLTWAHGAPEWHGRYRIARPAVQHGRIELRLSPRSAAWILL